MHCCVRMGCNFPYYIRVLEGGSWGDGTPTSSSWVRPRGEPTEPSGSSSICDCDECDGIVMNDSEGVVSP